MNPQIEGGDTIWMKKEHTAHVSFVNTLGRTLSGAVLTVKGSGLLAGKHEAKWVKAGEGKKKTKRNKTSFSSSAGLVLLTEVSQVRVSHSCGRCVNLPSMQLGRKEGYGSRYCRNARRECCQVRRRSRNVTCRHIWALPSGHSVKRRCSYLPYGPSSSFFFLSLILQMERFFNPLDLLGRRAYRKCF